MGALVWNLPLETWSLLDYQSEPKTHVKMATKLTTWQQKMVDGPVSEGCEQQHVLVVEHRAE